MAYAADMAPDTARFQPNNQPRKPRIPPGTALHRVAIVAPAAPLRYPASMNPLLLLFDLDGTLVDSRADLAAAVNAMRVRNALPPLDLATVCAYVGDGVRNLAIRSLQGAPVDVDLAVAQIGDAYSQNLFDHTRPYPGVDDGLRALHAAGHLLALVTNKPSRHSVRLVEHFGWASLFSLVVGGGDVPELKPSPLPLRHAMQRLGRTPADTWMIGDHHTDLEAARRAGVPSVLLLHGFGHPAGESPALALPSFEALVRHFLDAPYLPRNEGPIAP
jgi:phosphoglycolate phosphatase